MVFGLWTEVAQGSAPGREPSMHDLINDAMGGMMAVTLIVGQSILAGNVTGRVIRRSRTFQLRKEFP